MANFANQAAFNDPTSYQRALGVDLNTRNAIVDVRGNVLAYAQTGGMLGPQRYELTFGATIFRFGGANRGAEGVAAGGWWLGRPEFEKLESFAQTWGLAIGGAARYLCLVPPEWSDMTLLVRARLRQPLLAWRGLANSVVTPAKGGGPKVRMPEQNDIAARRLHQLFIPGLNEPGMAQRTLAIEGEFPLNPSESARGFLYI